MSARPNLLRRNNVEVAKHGKTLNRPINPSADRTQTAARFSYSTDFTGIGTT
ncbi:hypothetical protein MUP77_09380 [Candidatus Bathyarchaeota archaeon]|nr:hypothetical protein [Candidatus Bathyarchaeota archaeon]